MSGEVRRIIIKGMIAFADKGGKSCSSSHGFPNQGKLGNVREFSKVRENDECQEKFLSPFIYFLQ